MVKKLLGGFLIGGLLLSGGGLALAGSDNTSANDQSYLTTTIHGLRMPGMGTINNEIAQSVLDSLVSAGTLSQAQADTILTREQQREKERQTQMGKMQSMTKAERETACQENRPERVDLLAQLVADSTITQEQADAIQAATRAKFQEQRQAALTGALTGLVEKGVINEQQSTAIAGQLKQFQTARQAQMQARQGINAEDRQSQRETMQSMTAVQRQAYREANKPEMVNPLADLVNAGTLTQAQADQVIKAISIMHGGQGMQRGPGNGEGGMKGPGPQNP